MKTILKIQVCGEKGVEEMNRAQRIFRAVKILYDIIIMDIHHYTFIRTHRMHNTKSEP